MLNVEKAVVVARCGAPLIIRDRLGSARLVQATEGITSSAVAHLAELSGSSPGLVLTGHRMNALGAPGREHAVLLLPSIDGLDVEGLIGLADPTGTPRHRPDHLARFEVVGEVSCEAAAVRLAAIAGLLPTAVVASVPARVKKLASWAKQRGLPIVEADDVFGYHDDVAQGLRPVIEARVPLAGAEQARVVAFRSEGSGVEHFAIVIGQPRLDRPVLARLHSECFTGDLLGSLRCDCGDQLHQAINEMARSKDGGVLLYLAQEGRGIGLVNKLRAYALQDRGFDTVEANLQLGFMSDERSYRPAAEMLRRLGFTEVRLMTNNPDKVAALLHYGIRVVQRVPLALPPNPWNAAYLRTKAVRAGHLLDLAGPVETGPATAHEPGEDSCRTRLRPSEV